MLRREEEFVGRASELTVLQRALEEADRGRGTLILVTGEAGIGKSTLADQARRIAERRGHEVLSGRSAPIDDIAFDAFVQMLRGVPPQVLAALDPADRQHLAPLIEGRSARAGPPGNRAALILALERLLRQIASRRPLLVIIDDLHWADESTVSVLDALARWLTDSPVVFIVTIRHPGLDGNDPPEAALGLARIPHAARLDLTGLSVAEVRSAVAPVLGKEPSQNLTAQLHRRSLGNPLFVLELARSIAAEDGRPTGALRELFAETLATLPAQSRLVVEVAALLAGTAPAALLARASGISPEEVSGVIAAALRARVLVADGDDVGIRHPLLAETVTESIAPDRLRQHHGQIAAALTEAPELAGATPSARIAYHCAHAGDDRAALRAHLAAAQEAATTSGFSAAVAHLERACALWPQVPDADATTGMGLGDALAMAAGLAIHVSAEHAVDLGRRAVAAPAISPAVQGERLLALVEALRYGYDPAGEAEQVLERAMDLIPDEANLARARAEVHASWNWDTDPERARRHGHRAIELTTALNQPALLAQALVQTGGAEVVLGNTEEGLRLARQGRAVAEEAGGPLVLFTYVPTAAMLTFAGRPGEAADLALAGRSRSRGDGGEMFIREAITGFALAALTHAGRWDQARELADEVEIPGRFAEVAALERARFLALTGSTSAAGHLLDRRSAAGAGRDARYALARAWCALLTGDTAALRRDAVRGLHEADRLDAAATNELVYLAVAGIVGLARRERATSAAEPATQEMLSRLRPDPGGIVTAEAWSLSARAEAASLKGGAVDLWRTAMAAWEERDGWPHVAVLMRSRLAVALLEPYDQAENPPAEALAEAEALLGVALTSARVLPSPPLTELVTARARQIGLELAGAGPRQRLTERERQVLTLVADGCSNRVIARELRIAEKTVSVHVSNLVRKLGVSSRTEAAVQFARGH